MTKTCLGWLRPLLAVGALVAAGGCSALDNCPDARDQIFIDRPETTDTTALRFESSLGWKSFDEFPAKTEIKYKHGLGVVPSTVKGYLSFTAKATNGDEGGSFTEAAGNEIAWECLDSDTIVIKNDTCERSFFVKIVADGLPDGETDNHDCTKPSK